MAAVLACGPGALLSHRSAGALLELLPTSRSSIDVTATQHRRGAPGLVVHRTARIDRRDRSEREGIPVTSVMRTLVDLADVVSLDRLRRAIEQAEHRRWFDLRALPDLRGRRGRGRLRELLTTYLQPEATRSELERLFLELCRRARLPMPSTNVVVAGLLIDAVWPAQRLVVELDGYTDHGKRTAFEEDRRRDAALQLAGYRVLRFTYRRLVEEPEQVIRALRAMLREPT
jgi:very-short-patch-repair endonuclease